MIFIKKKHIRAFESDVLKKVHNYTTYFKAPRIAYVEKALNHFITIHKGK